MTKAEERALEAYPYLAGEWMGCKTFQPMKRSIYKKAYEQAEKDLALTIEDLERIHTFLYAVKNNKQGVFTFTRLSDEQYQEILRRFNQVKK